MQSMPFAGNTMLITCRIFHLCGVFVTFLSGCCQAEEQMEKLMSLLCCTVAINCINNDNDLTFIEQKD